MTSSAETKPDLPTHQEGFLYSAVPALASGAAQAILFNPVDRALYVRVKFRRKRFLDWRNFERPFQGFFNAAVYRTLVGASYMFWQDSARLYIKRHLPQACQAETSPQLNSFIIGLFAGSVNGLALNTLQAVKFRMWNTDNKGVTFVKTARLMYQEAGIPIFFRGCMTTMVRDSVFGVIYETTRRSHAWREFFHHYVTLVKDGRWHRRGAERDGADRGTDSVADARVSASTGHEAECGLCVFVSNLVAAIMASMLSSPFNYVRSVVYGTPPGAIPLGYLSLLKSFYTQLFYIWRNGQSYTDLYRIPKLEEVEHVGKDAAGTTNSVRRGAHQPQSHPSKGNSVRASPAAARAATEASSGGWAARTETKMGRWARVNRQHPIAACRWANSRLNIGWGSIRVGLGMAMSQSLFHMTQNYARKRSAAQQTSH